MKVQGLGDERRNELFQIQALVEQVDEFSADQFKWMVEQYKNTDIDTYKVLQEATQTADKNYERYLNKRLVGGKMDLNLVSLQDSTGEGTFIGKAMGEMREKIKNEKEYRTQFLGPQIGKQIQLQEIQLRKAQKEEIKKQRDENRALARSYRKGLNPFDFGI